MGSCALVWRWPDRLTHFRKPRAQPMTMPFRDHVVCGWKRGGWSPGLSRIPPAKADSQQLPKNLEFDWKRSFGLGMLGRGSRKALKADSISSASGGAKDL